MPIVIIQTKGGLIVERYSKNDFRTMKAALKWKRAGNWELIKAYVYRRKLNKKTVKMTKKRRNWFG